MWKMKDYIYGVVPKQTDIDVLGTSRFTGGKGQFHGRSATPKFEMGHIARSITLILPSRLLYADCRNLEEPVTNSNIKKTKNRQSRARYNNLEATGREMEKLMKVRKGKVPPPETLELDSSGC